LPEFYDPLNGLLGEGGGNGNFENDGALDHVYRLLSEIAGRVDKAVAKLPGQKNPVFDALMADVELLGVIARHVFKPASFTWIVRGQLLPDHFEVRAWKAVVLRVWDRQWSQVDDAKQMEELAACRKAIAATFDDLARLSRRQIFGAMRQFDAYMREMYGNDRRMHPNLIEQYEQRMIQLEQELKENARRAKQGDPADGPRKQKKRSS
jgi:hypothetical protein